LEGQIKGKPKQKDEQILACRQVVALEGVYSNVCILSYVPNFTCRHICSPNGTIKRKISAEFHKFC